MRREAKESKGGTFKPISLSPPVLIPIRALAPLTLSCHS